MIRIVLALGAIVLASLTTAVRASATPIMKGATREPVVLQEQVVHLFDRLDHVSQSSRACERISRGPVLGSRSCHDRSRRSNSILNRRAAEAYMAGLAGAFDSALGASSFSDLQDALEFLDAVSQRDHDVLIGTRAAEGGGRAAAGPTRSARGGAPGKTGVAGGDRCRPRREAAAATGSPRADRGERSGCRLLRRVPELASSSESTRADPVAAEGRRDGVDPRPVRLPRIENHGCRPLRRPNENRTSIHLP